MYFQINPQFCHKCIAQLVNYTLSDSINIYTVHLRNAFFIVLYINKSLGYLYLIFCTRFRSYQNNFYLFLFPYQHSAECLAGQYLLIRRKSWNFFLSTQAGKDLLIPALPPTSCETLGSIYVNNLCLSFHNFKMGIVLVPNSQNRKLKVITLLVTSLE